MSRCRRILAVLGMDPDRPVLWLGVEPTSGPAESWLRRVLLLSLQVKGLTIAQFPNASLTIGFVAGMASGAVHDPWQAVARAVAACATTFWGYQELVHGVNWFRHLLGIYALVGVLVRLSGWL